MKSAIAVCVVIALVGVQGHTIHLTSVQKEKILQNKEQCIKETGVKPEVIAEAKKGHISDDEGLKKFTLCFLQKSGLVDTDGKVNVDTVLAKLPEGFDRAEAQKLLETCKNKTGKDAADTAFESMKCFKQGTKTHISLLDA